MAKGDFIDVFSYIAGGYRTHSIHREYRAMLFPVKG